MKTLINYEEAIEIINRHRGEHKKVLDDYHYSCSNEKPSIDDVIKNAEAIKEFEQMRDEIVKITPTAGDLEPIRGAVFKLANAHSSETDKHNQDIKIIADFLGIKIEESENDEQ